MHNFTKIYEAVRDWYSASEPMTSGKKGVWFFVSIVDDVIGSFERHLKQRGPDSTFDASTKKDLMECLNQLKNIKQDLLKIKRG